MTGTYLEWFDPQKNFPYSLYLLMQEINPDDGIYPAPRASLEGVPVETLLICDGRDLPAGYMTILRLHDDLYILDLALTERLRTEEGYLNALLLLRRRYPYYRFLVRWEITNPDSVNNRILTRDFWSNAGFRATGKLYLHEKKLHEIFEQKGAAEAPDLPEPPRYYSDPHIYRNCSMTLTSFSNPS